MNNYEITLNYIENVYDETLHPEAVYGTMSGGLVDIAPYYEGRIIRLGISATGSSYADALTNTLAAAAGTPFDTSY